MLHRCLSRIADLFTQPFTASTTALVPSSRIHRRKAAVLARAVIDSLEPRLLLSAQFAVTQNTSIQGSLEGVASGDFNGDGKADLAVADATGYVQIELGDGTGHFAAPTAVAVPNGPYGITVGDFNGDHHLDIVTANAATNTISILLGNGDGTFQSPVNVAVLNAPIAIVAGDFNKDGNLDVAVANTGDNIVSILQGDGTGTLRTSFTIVVGSGPVSLAVGDVFGTGNLDIVTANYADNTVSLLAGNGNGTFYLQSTSTTDSSPRAVALGDFAGTGTMEMAVAAANDVEIMHTIGSGLFNLLERHATAGTAQDIAAADFTNDGKTDLVIGLSNANAVLMPGNGDGTFQDPVDAVSTIPSAIDADHVAVVDLNGDGIPDLTTTDNAGATNAILLNNTQPTPTHLAITQSPYDNPAGANLAPGLTVAVEGDHNTTVTNDSSTVTVSIASGPNGATLGGTTSVQAVNGVANFSDLTLTVPGAYTLTFTDGSLAVPTTSSFNITAGPADHIVLPQSFADVTAGAVLSPITATIVDAYGNTCTTDTSDVTIGFANGGIFTQGSTTTVQAVNGVATFTNLFDHKVDTIQLKATDGSISGTGATFNVLPAAAAAVVFYESPSNATAGSIILPAINVGSSDQDANSPPITGRPRAIAVGVIDQYGNAVTTDNSTVTISIATGPNGATLSGTLSVQVNDSIAVFTNLSLNVAGDYTLQAADASLTADTSGSFTITAAAADHLVFTQTPTNATPQVPLLPVTTVQIADAFGNLVTTDSSTVTLGLSEAPNGGTLSGTTTAQAINGVAVFSDISVLLTGEYTLHATDGALTAADADAFIMAGTAHQRYLEHLYQDVLGRPLDATGLACWGGMLDNGSSYAQVAAGVTASLEYRTHVIDGFYTTYLGRHVESGPTGLDFWLNQMQAGATPAQIRAAILGSNEYYANHGGTDAGFVAGLYTDILSRAADTGPTGSPYWLGRLQTESRAKIAAAFSASDEHYTDLVAGYYQAYLGRTPALNESAPWTTALSNNASETDLITAFVSSPEYVARTTAVPI
jgi:hypothetical protein